MDGPAGFGKQENSGQKEGSKDDSLWRELGALIKAMAEEMPGGGGATAPS
jgi:hypothetical protein